MLLNLMIRNIAIADNIDIDWSPGMTSISGETGAGKSILLNSLNLALGDRADSSIVRFGQKRAEVIATFDVSRIDPALAWLKERELDNQFECILRRTVSSEGRSRGFINGQPVPLTELKMLGEFLIDIHSQHAHQSLLRHETHLRLLDEYSGLLETTEQVRQAWLIWQGLDRKYRKLQQSSDDQNARIQLLEYQCEELDELDLQEDEVIHLETEFKRMLQSETLLSGSHNAKALLDNDENSSVIDNLKSAVSHLKGLQDQNSSLESALNLLISSLIQTEEGLSDLENYIDSFVFDEERQQWVEERLNQIHTLSRKHNVNSAELSQHAITLQQELSQLTGSEQSLEQLKDELGIKRAAYIHIAEKLTAKRKKSAVQFETEIVEKLSHLAMPGAQFEVSFSKEDKASPSGLDKVEYLISLNRGQPMQPLAKVASGGELSRVSLAIQVICAEHSTIPTLVFDEVDVGISGATAEIVGHMLRTVGAKGQVIGVTHQPQVAALGHNHCIVKKHQDESSTTTQIHTLNDDGRVSEIARMLGGIDITAQTTAHAEEMLRAHTRAH